MKGYRFYLEHETPSNKRNGEHTGNVFARCLDNGGYWSGESYMVEGAGAMFSHGNSSCAWTGASVDWLSTHCKRISEAQARDIHPQLFAYLEASHE